MPFDVSFACPDWVEKLEAGETPIPKLPINETLADEAVRCYDQLRIPDIIGQPTFGEAGGDWFRDIIRAAFGCVDPASVKEDPDTGEIDREAIVRMVGEIFLLVPKKNAKTTSSAGLGVTALLLNIIPHARMIIVGPTKQVADTCFSQASGMIKADPKLSQILIVQDHRQRIIHATTGAVLEIKTFDMTVLTGTIPIFVILDELHLMSSKTYAKKVLGQIRGGFNKKNCLLVIITTQSAEEPSGVFKTELNYARAVRDGKVPSENLLVVLYEFSEKMQLDESKPWLDPRTWYMVTPNLGRSVSMDILQREMRKVKEKGDEDTQLWLSQHLNIQIGMGLHSNRWIGVDWWPQSQKIGLSLEDIIETSEVCVVGIDGGGMDDLLGIAVLGRHTETKNWQHWGKAWADHSVVEKRKSIAEKLRDFEEDGDLVICSNGIDDIAEIAEICAKINKAGLFPEHDAIGLDPEGVAAIIDALIAAGITDDQLAAVTQGYKLNAAIKGTPRKLKNGSFVHCGQPLMTWCVGNAKTEMRGNAQLVTKQVSGSAKIDPLMALFNSVMLMSRNPEASNPESVYRSRGLLAV